ncbi:hypothetical protein [Lyngbya sp. PCC 8106]|uniref:hypothetical protein n=1 Tax=Lyngbya sp. (strain PCC 8106) TaxID=313612 RepID=UPI001E3C4E95|nr:hypothetical protein [Lyngbya sp. PCC 8106]
MPLPIAVSAPLAKHHHNRHVLQVLRCPHPDIVGWSQLTGLTVQKPVGRNRDEGLVSSALP